MRDPVCIAVGGALGSVLRFWVALWTAPISDTLPLGVIGINVVGSFLIGFFGTLTLARGRFPVPEAARLFFMVGFCGGFTTFSSFSLQSLQLLQGGAWPRALANVMLSVLLCLAAVALGHVVAARFNNDAESVVQLASEEEE